MIGAVATTAVGQAGQGNLLRKSANVVEANSTSEARSSITIRLDGLRPADFVNIRPGKQLAVSAGTLAKGSQAVPGLDAQRTFRMEALKAGDPPPDSSLEVTPSVVRFSRPYSDDTAFLDIEVPKSVRVRIIADGKTVLRASLRQPLAFRNQQWGEGALGVPGTAMRAAMPGLATNSAPPVPVYDKSTGSYIVPASSLTVTKKEPLKGRLRQNVVVVLQIDETGRVVGVRPLTDSAPPDLEQILSGWRFEPYIVNGNRVRVSTVLPITVE